MKLVIGAVYEKEVSWGAKTLFVVVSECLAESVRFKRMEPGYSFLVLNSDNPDFVAGEVFQYVAGANFFTKLKRFA